MEISERVWLSEGCCSFSTLADNIQLCFSLLLGVAISAGIAYLYSRYGCQTDKKFMDGRPPSAKLSVSDTGECTSPECKRCRQKSFVNILGTWRKVRATIKTENDVSFARLEKAVRICELSGRFVVPELRKIPFWSPGEMGKGFVEDIAVLESNWQLILSEFCRNVDCEEAADGWVVNVENQWRIFHLVNQGLELKNNTFTCPETWELIRGLKGFIGECVFGYACFSVLLPGAEIKEHVGPTNIRLRVHLGLSIAEGKESCELCVNDERKEWTAGSCLVFDDHLPHSVVHYRSRARVVLMIDFWHPDISQEERLALQNLFLPLNP